MRLTSISVHMIVTTITIVGPSEVRHQIGGPTKRLMIVIPRTTQIKQLMNDTRKLSIGFLPNESGEKITQKFCLVQ